MKSCRICLKNEEIFVTESTFYKDFFVQVVGVKNVPNNIWLCIWCRAALKNVTKLIKTMVASQKVLAAHREIVHKTVFDRQRNNEKKLGIYVMSYHHTHIDIPPNTPSDVTNISVESDNRDIGEKNKINEKTTKTEVTLGSEIDKIKEESNTTDFQKAIHNTDDKKERKRRNDLNCDEMKFVVKYLSLEEQRREIEDNRASEKNRRMKYHCTYCGVGFLTVDIFDQHMLRHDENAGPHECMTCHLRFKSQEVLSQHTLAHRRRFICAVCNTTYKRWSHCITHRYKCGGISAPIACDYCNKIFSNYHSLDVHTKGVHKKDKKYACEQCEKRFNSKQRLTVHTRTHTGLKPFACEHCNKTFATNSNLRSHSIVHVESKPHYCVECNTYYKSEKGLKRHFMESAKHLNARK